MTDKIELFDKVDYSFKDGRIWVDLGDLFNYFTEEMLAFMSNKNAVKGAVKRHKVNMGGSDVDISSFIAGAFFATEFFLSKIYHFGATKESINKINNVEDLLKEWGEVK